MSHGGYQPGPDPREWQSPGNPYPPQGQPGYGGQGGPGYADPGYANQGYDQGYGNQGQGYGDPGWQGGYGQPYGAAPQPADPYAQQAQQPGYGPPGPYGPPYGPPRDEGLRTHAIVALVIGIVLSLSCYFTLGGLPLAILAGIALSKMDVEPQTSRKLLKWGWISIGINVGLFACGIAFGIIYGILEG